MSLDDIEQAGFEAGRRAAETHAPDERADEAIAAIVDAAMREHEHRDAG